MNLSWKFPLIHHITKDLTLCSSFARKASILLKANEIALPVRLSPVFSISASFAPPQLGASRQGPVGGWRRRGAVCHVCATHADEGQRTKDKNQGLDQCHIRPRHRLF